MNAMTASAARPVAAHPLTEARWHPRLVRERALEDAEALPSREAQLLQELMAQAASDDIGLIMGETALHLQHHTGWRWAMIARLGDDGRVAQMLALVDGGRRIGGVTYELELTPCATLAEVQGVQHFDQAARRFPGCELLQRLGVEQYAGLVCRRGGVPIAHVVLMHDRPLPSAQAERADALLQLTAMHVGGRLELAGMRNTLRDVQRQAETDALTQLPNRHAFERELAVQLSLVREGARSDSLLAIIDVNGLKAVNDELGHLAGDTLLRRVAEGLRGQLRRHQDQVFRIGGDEFAILTDGPNTACADWLFERSQHIAQDLRQAGFAQAGLSIGLATLSETSGHRTAWLALADARMYAHKGSKRRN